MVLPSPGLSFTCLRNTLTEYDAEHLEIASELEPGYAVSAPFLRLFLGGLEEVPTLMGLAPAKVDMHAIAGGARYDIRVPRAGFLARLRRAITRPVSMAIQLKETQQILYDRTEALESEVGRRTRVEELLRDSAERYRTRLENTNDVIVA